LNAIFGKVKLPILVLAAIVLVYGALLLSGSAPVATMQDMVTSSLGSAASLSATLKEVLPLLIAGAAVFFALKAGLFNIGVEGQFTVGALGCAVVALQVPGPLGIVLGIVVGSLIGGLWALPAGLIKAYKGGHEVITTIMLNNIAALWTTALVSGPFRDPQDQSPTTRVISDATKLPLLKFGAFEVSSGMILALLMVFAIWFWLKKTVAGYELQAVGANPTAAQFAGVDPRRVIVKAMFWSGAMGGLGGAIQVLALQFRFYPSISSGYGFDALGVAMLAGVSSIGLIPAALLFGALTRGGNQVAILDGVPKGITGILLGILIIVAAAVRYRKAGTASA
jgi:simple sugar transport system permease protein